MSVLIHTVAFNKDVTFTDQTGITFVNTTTAETASLVTSATVSPASLIEYSVTWAVDPIAGDVVEWRYDGLGTYEDKDAVAMESQVIALVNCLDPTEVAFNLQVLSSGATGATMTWTEPVDVSLLTTYKLYRNNVFVKDIAIGVSSAFGGNLIPNTNYSYRLDTLFLTSVIGSTSDTVKTEILVPPLVAISGSLSSRVIGTSYAIETNSAPLNRATEEFNTARF